MEKGNPAVMRPLTVRKACRPSLTLSRCSQILGRRVYGRGCSRCCAERSRRCGTERSGRRRVRQDQQRASETGIAFRVGCDRDDDGVAGPVDSDVRQGSVWGFDVKHGLLKRPMLDEVRRKAAARCALLVHRPDTRTCPLIH